MARNGENKGGAHCGVDGGVLIDGDDTERQGARERWSVTPVRSRRTCCGRGLVPGSDSEGGSWVTFGAMCVEIESLSRTRPWRRRWLLEALTREREHGER